MCANNINDIDTNLLLEAYEFHLKGEPFLFKVKSANKDLGKFFHSSINGQLLVDLGYATPISIPVKSIDNTTVDVFNSEVSFSLTESGVNYAKKLSS